MNGNETFAKYFIINMLNLNSHYQLGVEVKCL